MEIELICFVDWMEIGEVKVGEKKVNGSFGIIILGG